jgi:hypothetical protein
LPLAPNSFPVFQPQPCDHIQRQTPKIKFKAQFAPRIIKIAISIAYRSEKYLV